MNATLCVFIVQVFKICNLQVWDIRVGKVLTEFSHHGPVTDVEFHPHEFLLASGSMDRTVKFWELETFSLISSSIPDVPPVRLVLLDA